MPTARLVFPQGNKTEHPIAAFYVANGLLPRVFLLPRRNRAHNDTSARRVESCKPAHASLVEKKSLDPNSLQRTKISGKVRESLLHACPAGNVLILQCVGHKGIKDFFTAEEWENR